MKLGMFTGAVVAALVSASAALALPVTAIGTNTTDFTITASTPTGGTGVVGLSNPIAATWVNTQTVAANSEWIWDSGNTRFETITFTTTFDLTGFDVATAQIVDGQWATDNSGELYLNGNLIGTIANPGFTAYTAMASGAGSFVAGINTVDFVVLDRGPSASGLRAAFAVEADLFVPPPVPVPAALPLMLAGVAGLGFAARRRKAS